MKIREVTEATVQYVTMEDDTEYVRYNAECWSIFYGLSQEDVHFCEGLEAKYQEYLALIK
jgi:hypothetical protein